MVRFRIIALILAPLLLNSCGGRPDYKKNISLEMINNRVVVFNEQKESSLENINSNIENSLMYEVSFRIVNHSNQNLYLLFDSNELVITEPERSSDSVYKMTLQIDKDIADNVLSECLKDTLNEFIECKVIYDSIGKEHYYRRTGDIDHYYKKNIIENSLYLGKLDSKTIKRRIHLNNSENCDMEELIGFLQKNSWNARIVLHTKIGINKITLENINPLINENKNNFLMETINSNYKSGNVSHNGVR